MSNADRKWNFAKRRIQLLAWQLTDVQPNEGSALMNREYILTNIPWIDDLGEKRKWKDIIADIFLVQKMDVDRCWSALQADLGVRYQYIADVCAFPSLTLS